MKLKRLAQSTILLTLDSGNTLLIDPGKYNIGPGKFTHDTFLSANVIVITHKHADHFDLEILRAILSRSKPTIITNEEIKETLDKEGIPSKVMTEGSKMSEAGFTLQHVNTDHVVRGEFIVNFGLVITGDGRSLYYTSDTRFIDPSLLPEEVRAKYLLLPISNRGVVMGIDDALVFARDLHPELVIPLHYDSPKDRDRVDPVEFEQKSRKFGFNTRIMEFGEELEL